MGSSVTAIGSTTTQLKMDEVVAALLSKEMRKRSFEVAKEALVVRNQSKDNKKKKFKAKCWNFGHTGHIQKDCKEKKKKKKVESSSDSESSDSDGEDANGAALAEWSS